MARFSIVLLAAGLVASTACNRSNKAEQLAALNGAYQSGLLTKGEYDAKRRALTTQAPEPVTTQAPVPAPNPAPAAAPPERNSAARAVHRVIGPAWWRRYQRAGTGSARGLPGRAIQVGRAERRPGSILCRASGGSPARGGLGTRQSGFQHSQELEQRKRSQHTAAHRRSGRSRWRARDRDVPKGGARRPERHSRGGETKKSFVGRMAQKTWTDAVLAQIDCKLRESSR
jgi:hypothetical protein